MAELKKMGRSRLRLDRRRFAVYLIPLWRHLLARHQEQRVAANAS